MVADKNVWLTDVSTREDAGSTSIDFLIGANACVHILTQDFMKGNYQLVAIKTQLCWTVRVSHRNLQQPHLFYLISTGHTYVLGSRN